MSAAIDRPGVRRSAAGLGLALVGLLLVALVASGAEPSSTPADVVAVGGDPRSEGSGPGLVGSPLLILMAVVLLGVVVAALTAVLARYVTRDRG